LDKKISYWQNISVISELNNLVFLVLLIYIKWIAILNIMTSLSTIPPAGDIKIEVIFNDETFWLNQKKMAELFGVDVRTVNEHLQNIYKTNELDKAATTRKIRIVQKEGKYRIRILKVILIKP
jgi:hypothetical protein